MPAFGANDLDTIKKLYQRKILMAAILAVHLLSEGGIVVCGGIKNHVQAMPCTYLFSHPEPICIELHFHRYKAYPAYRDGHILGKDH